MGVHHRRLTAVAVASVLLVVAGCGDDDDDSADTTQEPAETTAGPAETTAVTTAATDADDTGDTGDSSFVVADEDAELCALATTLFNQESFPTAEQLEQYQALAPDEIADAVNTAVPLVLAAGDDLTAQLATFASDEVEAPLAEINAWELEHCGLEHDPVGEQGPEDGAAVVDVTATDFSFDAPSEVPAGRTSFVLTNNGSEAHFLGIFRAADGHTVEEALMYEGDAEADGIIEADLGATGLAAPGGDTEFVTVDLEPGTYGIYCFLPSVDGTPHVALGMMGEITVT